MKIQDLPDGEKKERLRRHVYKIKSLRAEEEQHRLAYEARIRQVRIAQESSAKWIKEAYDLPDDKGKIVDSISEDGKELTLLNEPRLKQGEDT